MMKKFFKFTGLFLLVVFFGVIAYCVCVIQDARKYTRDVVSIDLSKAQWRQLDGTANQFEITIKDLSQRQKQILIKVEDPGFYNHKGIDLSTPGAGLTTITQAIVKKMYFDVFKPGIDKLKQSVIARFVVNDMISKEDQLTVFINAMYFGDVDGTPVIGLESAAKAYYHLTTTSLSEHQYISLIAMLVAPNTFHLINHPEWNEDRTNRIKAFIAGEYQPTGLMDQFFGELPKEVIDAGLPPASYLGKPSEATDNNENKPNE